MNVSKTTAYLGLLTLGGGLLYATTSYDPGKEEKPRLEPVKEFFREVYFANDIENSYLSDDRKKIIPARHLNSEGEFQTRLGGSELVITAPHGAFDKYTDEIVKDICSKNRAPFPEATCIIGKYFRISKKQASYKDPVYLATGERSKVLSDVNRPTSMDSKSMCTRQDPIARSIYQSFLGKIPKKPKLYVEIHGFKSDSSGRKLDIVYYRLDKQKLKENLGDLKANIGLSEVIFKASQSRKCGVLGQLRKNNFSSYLHIELPTEYRSSKLRRMKTAEDLSLFIEKALNTI